LQHAKKLTHNALSANTVHAEISLVQTWNCWCLYYCHTVWCSPTESFKLSDPQMPDVQMCWASSEVR